MVIKMNFKRILAISLILATLCMTVTAISASNDVIIDIGEITKGEVNVSSSFLSSDVDVSTDIEVNISNLSANDKEQLLEAITHNTTIVSLNLTSGDTVKYFLNTFMSDDEAYIEGDTLYLKTFQKSEWVNSTDNDLKVDAVSFDMANKPLLTT